MIVIHGKKWEKLSDEEKIAICDEYILTAEDERKPLTWDWYVNKQFLDGNHYIRYNATTNAIENPPERKDRVRLVINKTKTSARAVANYATRYKPRWEVLPGDDDNDTNVGARRAGKVLDHLYRTLHIRAKIRSAVDFSLWTSIGIWEHGFDPDIGKNGDVFIKSHDPFDIIIPLNAELEGPVITSSPFVAKVFARDVDLIHNDSRYNEKNRSTVTADGELSLSELKKNMKMKRGEQSQRDKRNTALVREIMIWDAEGKEKKGNIQLVTYAGDVVLRDEPLKRTKYPFLILQPEDVYQLYSKPWISHIIPTNKALDRLESLILEYNVKMNRARILAEKGHGVNLAGTGRSGVSEVEVLEYNPGRKFEQMQILPLPLTINRQIDNLNRYIDVLSGASQISPASLPSNIRSTGMLEQLQATDANNLSGIREALEDFLSVAGERLLEEVDEHYSTSRVIKVTDPEEGIPERMKVVGKSAAGENGKELEKQGKAFTIEPGEVIVTIGSWLGYTREAQRTTMLDLLKLRALPGDEVLRQFEFPNVEGLSEKAKRERLEESELQADIAGRRSVGGVGQGGRPMQGGGMQPPAGPPSPDVDLADEENAAMMDGQPLPPTPGATPEHTEAHILFAQAPEVQQDQQVQQILRAHIEGELLEQQGGGMGAAPAGPMGGGIM